MIKNHLEPALVYIDGFNVTGLQVRTNNHDEFNPATAKLSDLWQRFFSENVDNTIVNRMMDSPIFGVYSDYESNAKGLYSVTAGIKVYQSSPHTRGFDTVNVLHGDYLIFENHGLMPHAVVETWKQIWHYFKAQNKFQRCFKTDFEMYKGDKGIAIYIGVSS